MYESYECYLVLRLDLRGSGLTWGVLWKIVNSGGADTQFYEILGGGIYYDSHKLANITDSPMLIYIICLFVASVIANGLSGKQ